MLRECVRRPEPPEGCRLVDHRERLERIFTRARLELPSQLPYTDENGLFDEDAYVGQLLERLGALGQVFTTSEADRALGSPGPARRQHHPARWRPVPAGGHRRGRHLPAGGQPGAHAEHARASSRIDVDVERDPSVAVTRLLSGDADWVLEVGDELESAVTDVPEVRAAARPLDVQFGILFNVRPDRVYFDVDTRRAFALCLDHDGAGHAARRRPGHRHDPVHGHLLGAPGIQPTAPRRGGRDDAPRRGRLDGRAPTASASATGSASRRRSPCAPPASTSSRFANEAAEQLAECGIELVVEELDLTGGTMLDQLLWPNDFDTLLLARTLGPDPDSAVRSFESSRITTAENQADANPSGFTSSLVDHLISAARESLDPAERDRGLRGRRRTSSRTTCPTGRSGTTPP